MSMDPPPAPVGSTDIVEENEAHRERRESLSQHSENSQTAADFIRDQMQLEADAREALPYSFKHCTKPLGSLRQNVFACLTCNPPPADPNDDYTPAGVCYSCSVQCHGEHELVEIFQKRNFTCDCGTTRFRADQPCKLRNAHSEAADANNKYNQNFRNRFCSCSIDYKPQEQKGTMFQCLGLGTHETGGCGEDWYHPGCLVGMGPQWYEKMDHNKTSKGAGGNSVLPAISEDRAVQEAAAEEDDNDVPLPDGFPGEDDFEHFLCYKCVDANPWIRRYAGTAGFLPAVFYKQEDGHAEDRMTDATSTRKRKLDSDEDNDNFSQAKRVKSEQPEGPRPAAEEPSTEAKQDDGAQAQSESTSACKLGSLPPPPSGLFSLFFTSGFRSQFCRCPSCFPHLKDHPQLLEEEDAYEPPLSDSASNDAGSDHNSGGSLLERGESALRNVDRVRAIEGVMAYNHLKDKLKPFFQQFAESGQAISAEDIKEYFAKLRGDQEAIRDAGQAAKEDGDNRREQSGY